MKHLFFAFIAFATLLFTLPSLAVGLKVGDKAPAIEMTDIAGKNFSLKNHLEKGPVVLVFYRGGWCPFCNTQLRTLQSAVVPKLKAHKATMVAISVDLPNKVAETQKKESLGMTLLSDPKASLIKAYSVVNKVPDELVKTYKDKYGLDLEAASGEKHHIIAVPAVYTIAQDGKISFAYANEDYKVRAQTDDILASLKKLKVGE